MQEGEEIKIRIRSKVRRETQKPENASDPIAVAIFAPCPYLAPSLWKKL
jgi:hypothetical protein